MSNETLTSKEAVAQTWVRALSDLDLFVQLCSPDCRVWHSNDNVWVTVEQAVDAAKARPDFPEFVDPRVVLTDAGFIVQSSVSLELGGQLQQLHIIQVTEMRDGKVVRVQEYIAPEMPI
ncbi:nuclear transport factor 2 family protein [Nocardia sp. alder85J]|uniref:nuclear transport factor 2 family protein n=1 Tax=Nocardia sp. alder85J TaxID=2862949 RepID=UPI001CD2D18E|nr:nuclear transport factor 2 family protein [Nocardia sp. alder85J]MCX4095560.1 nuclear transport factor 2 family protein [Nocardia sp. alder85J]